MQVQYKYGKGTGFLVTYARGKQVGLVDARVWARWFKQIAAEVIAIIKWQVFVIQPNSQFP